MKKRILAVLLLLALALVLPGRLALGSAACTPVTDTEYRDALSRLVGAERVLIRSPEENPALEYNPSMSRGEMVTTLVAAMGRREEGQVRAVTPPFADMADHWASGFAAVAKAEGLVQGYPDGTFRPNDKGTWTEWKVMIARLLRMPEGRPDDLDAVLRRAGIQRSFTCVTEQRLASLMVLLEQALSLSIYSRWGSPEEGPLAAGATAYDRALARLTSYGVVKDVPDQVSRLTMVQLLASGLGYQPPGGPWRALPFWDLDDPMVAAPMLAFAKSQGLVRGYPDGSFRPGAPLTVGEAKVMVARLLRAGPDLTPATADNLLRKVGVDPEIGAANEDVITWEQAVILADRAFAVPLYARFPE